MPSCCYFPAHLCSVLGVYHKFLEERKLPIEEQYIHSVVNSCENSILILTFNYHFIQLIHKMTSFEVDTTFKHAHGELNQWELVIWYAGENRCTSTQSSQLLHFSHPSPTPVITIGWVYVNRADVILRNCFLSIDRILPVFLLIFNGS
jgi:hypothetical protein